MSVKVEKQKVLGETALLETYILSESYRQNHFASDLRIREITQGNDLIGTGAGQVDRGSLYDRTMLLHSVPRFNNPTGTFDNDQYLVEFLTLATVAGRVVRDDLRGAIGDLLDGCPDAGCAVEPATSTVACEAPSVPV